MYSVYYEKVPDIFEGLLMYNYQVHEQKCQNLD